jgi:ATP-dependent helicase HepA
MATHRLARHFTQQWVEHRGSSTGLGLCRSVGVETAEVQYFSLPGVLPLVKKLPVAELRIPTSYVGHPAWIRSDPYGWRYATIERYDGRFMYLRFADGDSQKQSPSDIVIREQTPFVDVLRAVQNGVVEDAVPYLSRRDLLQEFILQRAAYYGYTSASSSAIAFFDHQLQTLQRVLEDPVCRFILADEVGLGKTIEAGLVIRQMVLDDPDAKIYISVPENLIGQWRNELSEKFLLGDLLEGPRVRGARISVREHAEILSVDQTEAVPDLLVIDEAHQLTALAKNTGQWSSVVNACSGAAGLLLLSATPMRGDYEVLEGLLHLVDPLAFPLGDPEAFARRVEERSAELSVVDALVSPFSGTTAKLEAIARIRARHPGDQNVQRLANLLDSGVEHFADTAQELGAYLRETYRLSRRMIRHRRSTGPAAEFPTSGRRGVFIVVDRNRGDELLDHFLDDYRDLLFGNTNGSALMWDALNSALSGLLPLSGFIDRRLTVLESSKQDDDEESILLKRIRAEIRLTDDQRLATVAREACRRVEEGQLVVAISSDTDQAKAFAAVAASLLSEDAIPLTHLLDQSQAANQDVLEDYLISERGVLLVGDRSLEEGTNLQGSHALVNIDLSLCPNMLEQRIGRVDRYVGSSRAMTPEIVVAQSDDSAWYTSALSILRDGIGVFDQSVSTAQRLLAHWESKTRQAVAVEGLSALDIDLEQLRADIGDEMVEVDELEAWESDTDEETANQLSASRISSYEARSEFLGSALMEINDPSSGLPLRVKTSANGLIFRFSVFERARTKLPPSLDAKTVKLLDRDFALSARDALEIGSATPFRVGDPLVEWLEHFIQTDERGRAFVAVVPDPTVGAWELWLKCDLLLHFDRGALASRPTHDQNRLGRRGDRFLPPEIHSVWASSTSSADAGIATHLESLLTVTAGQSAVIWADVHRNVPGWNRECAEAAQNAQRALQDSEGVRSTLKVAITEVQTDNARRQRVLTARSDRLPTQAERNSALFDRDLDHQLGQTILAGVSAPAFSLINCGALLRRPV